MRQPDLLVQIQLIKSRLSYFKCAIARVGISVTERRIFLCLNLMTWKLKIGNFVEIARFLLEAFFFGTSFDKQT